LAHEHALLAVSHAETGGADPDADSRMACLPGSSASATFASDIVLRHLARVAPHHSCVNGHSACFPTS
jgi:hypothetical protein